MGLIKEKRDYNNQIIIRASANQIFTDKIFIDLIKKYGKKINYPTNSDMPEYQLKDPVKIQLFVNKAKSIVPVNPDFNRLAIDIDNTLNGINLN